MVKFDVKSFAEFKEVNGFDNKTALKVLEAKLDELEGTKKITS